MKSLFFYREIRQISAIVLVSLAAGFVYFNGTAIAHAVLSPTGIIYTAFTLLSIVLALTIRIFFRILVIKYSEKNTRIKLFEEL